MSEYKVIDIIDGQPTFEKPLDVILQEVEQELLSCKKDGVFHSESKSAAQYITERQRKWYKGVCLRDLVKWDENGETMGWWDTEVKRLCGGLALLKKEILYLDDGTAVGRLTTKGVGVKNMRQFITEILSKAMQNGWPIGEPDADLRQEVLLCKQK